MTNFRLNNEQMVSDEGKSAQAAVFLLIVFIKWRIYIYTGTQKTELTENGNFSLFDANRKQKRQLSVCMLQMETENGSLFFLVFLGWQKINSNQRQLSQQTCPSIGIGNTLTRVFCFQKLLISSEEFIRALSTLTLHTYYIFSKKLPIPSELLY